MCQNDDVMGVEIAITYKLQIVYNSMFVLWLTIEIQC